MAATNSDDDSDNDSDGSGCLGLSGLNVKEPAWSREDEFHVSYDDKIVFTVKGLKRELGQTLRSTGLTVWRASDHLNDFIYHNQQRFTRKDVIELGSGLGIVSILLGKTNVASMVVCTDGDDDTMELLKQNIIETSSSVIPRKLWWSHHDEILKEFPNKFDIILGADIIYEESQIVPLFTSVVALLKEDGEFILAYARRNVPIDLVLNSATHFGLKHSIIDLGDISMEPVYSITWI